MSAAAASSLLPPSFRFLARPTPGVEEGAVTHALAEIAEAKSMSPARLDRWMELKDERILTAILESALVRRGTKASRQVVERVGLEAIEQALHAGEIWTPPLDALSALPAVVRSTPAGQEVERQLSAEVNPRLQRMRDAAELQGLIEGTRSARLLQALARRVPHSLWEEASVEALLRRMPKAVHLLGGYTDLKCSLYPLLLEGMVEMVARQEVEMPNSLEEQLYHSQGHLPPFPEKVFLNLYEQGARLTPRQRDRLLAVRKRGFKKKTGEGKEQAADGYLPYSPKAMLYAHLAATQDEEETIAFVRGCGSSQAVEYLFWPPRNRQEPRVLPTGRVLKEVLATFPRSSNLLVALARDPRARQEAEILSRLQQVGNAGVAAALLPSCSEEKFRELFGRVARREPVGAAEALEVQREVALRTLVRGDLAPLLQAKTADVRLQAIMLAPSLPLAREGATGRRRKGDTR